MSTGTPEDSNGVDLGRVRASTSVLVLAPEMEGPVEEVCNDLLQPEHPAKTGILKISYHFSPTELADRWRERNPDSQAKFYGLSITGSDAVSKPDSYGDQFSFETSQAGDLTGTGMEINHIFGELSTERSIILVGLDSLDSMLMYNDQQTVYRFVRTITNFLSSNNAQIHFHLDPAQHDDMVNTLKSAFNAVVEVGDDGEVDIKVR